MEKQMRQGAADGALAAILLILSQPFHPTEGLIPELAKFLTGVPMCLATMIFRVKTTPLIEGGVILVYSILVGALIAVAFEKKRLWGGLLIVAFVFYHYFIYDQFGRPMTEVMGVFLNHFGM